MARKDLKDPISVSHILVEGKTLAEFKKLYKGMIPHDPLTPEERYKKIKAEIKADKDDGIEPEAPAEESHVSWASDSE